MMSSTTERLMRRWQEERWILDTVVQTIGVEWDQPRLGYTMFACGPEAAADFGGAGMRVRRFSASALLSYWAVILWAFPRRLVQKIR